MLNFYFSFKGRATRYDFNVRYMLVAFIGAIIACVLDYIIWPERILYNIWTCLVFFSGLAITCRRLHDMDHSGWWQLIAHSFAIGLGVIVAFTIGAAFLTNPLAAGLGGFLAIGAFTIFYCAYFIFLSCKRGTIGPNKYGDDPLLISIPQTSEKLS